MNPLHLFQITWLKLLPIVVAFLALVCSEARAAADAKLNVVFILADDLGWADTTLYGHTKFYQTPNLERLAKRGMTLSRAYSASPLCSPTRSAILTGLSPARTGITSPNGHAAKAELEAVVAKTAPPNSPTLNVSTVTRLKPEYRTLAEALKDAGYATGHFGKWHLGPPPYSPLEQGFDVDVPHFNGPGPKGFVAPWDYGKVKSETPGEHIEDRMALEAAAFIAKHKERPFFLNYWMFSVHAPFDAKAALIEKHRARVNPADAQRSPTYAAMIESMDDAVGALLDALEKNGVLEKTVIIFTSDNGGNMYNEVDGTTPTSNAPLRGGKASMYEGGTRVPCVVAWPGVTAAGTQSAAQVQSEDYFPTLLDGLGLAQPDSQRFDGRSILPALRGQAFERGPLFQFFPHHPPVPDWMPPSVSVHLGDWKLIRLFHAGEKAAHRYKLFNLADDIGEKNDLAAAQPERVKELDALIEKFLTETKAIVPAPNPVFDPAKYNLADEGQAKPKAKAAPKKKPTP